MGADQSSISSSTFSPRGLRRCSVGDCCFLDPQSITKTKPSSVIAPGKTETLFVAWCSYTHCLTAFALESYMAAQHAFLRCVHVERCQWVCCISLTIPSRKDFMIWTTAFVPDGSDWLVIEWILWEEPARSQKAKGYHRLTKRFRWILHKETAVRLVLLFFRSFSSPTFVHICSSSWADLWCSVSKSLFARADFSILGSQGFSETATTDG